MHNKPGTVGRLLPGMRHRLEPVPGIEEGGQLQVQGPNVMLGYLKADAPGLLQRPADGWYDTGDIVTVDAQGFITIKGRTKRFAKIGGEMVSLTSVEQAVEKLWPEHKHAAVSLPDARKGEQIILLTDKPDAERDALVRHFRDQNIADIALPRRLIFVPELPLLGTGKMDYQGAKTLAGELMALNNMPAGS
jgi:acyl-[acyl-carrier-protein]-phospholipid O-acyltransferase/long-chain-fatty-acid--[acyl-carrier-protein] ligase